MSSLLPLEWRLLVRDHAVWIAGGLVVVSLTFAFASGARWRAFLVQAQQDVAQEEAARYAALAERIAAYQPGGRGADPRQASAIGGPGGARYARLPVLPLAGLSTGQSDLLPAAVRVSTDAREQVLSTAEIENPHRLLEGRFDVTFVILYLFPLLILALSYNVLAGERERGSLRLLASQPTPLSRLLMVRLGVRAAVIVGLTLAMGLAGAVATGAMTAGADTLGRLLLWVAGTVLYGAFWLAVALVVGSRGSGSAATAMTVTGVWLVLTVVVPAAVSFAVTTWYPMPSRVQMVQAMREASDAASARGSAVLARYFEAHPDLLPDGEQYVADAAATRAAVADEVRRLTQPVAEAFDAQAARQRAAADRLRYLSPTLLLRDLLDDVAGTGAARYAQFREQVSAFHAGWVAHFTDMAVTRRPVEHLEAVPTFAFVDETVGAVARRSTPPLALLAIAVLVLGWWSGRNIQRYPLTE